MLSTLALACLTMAPLPPGDRLYAVVHNAYMDGPRWERELGLVRELGFGGIRTSFAMADLLNEDRHSLSGFGRRWVDFVVSKVRGHGLKLHLTLGDDLPDTPPAVLQAAHELVVSRAASTFGPGELTVDIQNEPKAFLQSDPKMVDAINSRVARLERYWDASGLKSKGYRLLSPTFHGFHSDWVDGRSVPDLTLDESLKRYSARLRQVYGSSMGAWLRRVHPAINLYAPGRGCDAAEFESAMAAMVMRFFRDEGVPLPAAITEFGVFFGSGISDRAWAEKVATMAKVLLPMREVRFAAYYCLSDDPRYELISKEGNRNEGKIVKFKAALARHGLLRYGQRKSEGVSPKKASRA